MRIALVSCGPSANDFPGRRGFDALIACRDRACHIAADWWVIADVRPYVELAPLGRPRIFCTSNVETKLERLEAGMFVRPNRPERAWNQRHRDRWRGESVVLADRALAVEERDAMNSHVRKSGVLALWLAAVLGPAELHLWGIDLTGTGDAAGPNQGEDRTHRRWQRELSAVDCAVTHLRRLGVRVLSHGRYQPSHHSGSGPAPSVAPAQAAWRPH